MLHHKYQDFVVQALAWDICLGCKLRAEGDVQKCRVTAELYHSFTHWATSIYS